MRAAVLVLLLLVPAVAAAQAVIVEADGATEVLIDGERRGAPGDVLAVTAGSHEITVVDDPTRWDPRRVSARVTVGAADTLTVTLRLPVRVRVETLPLRAEVVWVRPDGTRLPLGTAPVTADLPADAAGRVEASLDGYASADAPLSAAPVLLTLTPLDPEVAQMGVAQFELQRSARRRWIDWGVGAATLAAGAVAVHYKFRADRVDDRYRSLASPERGDETLRQEAMQLDRYSAVALGAMQVGVGVLAVRLVLR